MAYNFILAGNGSYKNRGCEAIMRGTMVALASAFPEAESLAFSYFSKRSSLQEQVSSEVDERVTHRGWVYAAKYSPSWAYWQAVRMILPGVYYERMFQDLVNEIGESRAVLSIGGDNYSLDYGLPEIFVGLNNLVLRKRKPLVIWGASVGPFSVDTSYERRMIRHLARVYIFARESETISYLASHGLRENVRSVADPAFLLRPQAPDELKLPFKIQEDAIGLNLSPLMANYVTNGNRRKWVELAVKIVSRIGGMAHRPIYLIPHVVVSHSDDHAFLQDVARLCPHLELKLIPKELNAAELKWVIGRMAVFAGARTHATIAAMSCCVPTLSFGYSMKAKGINKDVFGHDKYCIASKNLSSDVVAERMEALLSARVTVRQYLEKVMPSIQQRALSAGNLLKEVVSADSGRGI